MVKFELKCPNPNCSTTLGGINFPQICSNCKSKIHIKERKRNCPKCLTVLGGLKFPQICSKCGHKTTLKEIQNELYIKEVIPWICELCKWKYNDNKCHYNNNEYKDFKADYDYCFDTDIYKREEILFFYYADFELVLNGFSVKKETNSNERLEELKGKCESDLESKVLDEIFKQNLPLPNGVQKTYYEKDIPITKVDFYYLEPERELCLFVDGPPHAPEVVQREDREKRNTLESKGYTIIELDFKDGKYRENPSLIEQEVLKLKDYLI